MTSTTPDPRHAARELVLQGLYQRQLSGNADEAIRLSLLESEAFPSAGAGYFNELWRGVTAGWETLLAGAAPHAARAIADLSPVERAIIAIGAWELGQRVEIPYKVVIDEAIELAKSYGGTDGHKFVNGVLDKVARDVRAPEIAARSAARSRTRGG
jgi:N utilization substance protein B